MSTSNNGRKSILQLLKFGLIGVSNTLVDLLVTSALNAIFGIYYLAKIIGYACGIANSYIWNSRWTFREERRRDKREIVSFIAVNLVTLGLSLLLQWILRDVWHLDAWWMGFAGENWFTKLLNGERFCILLAFPIPLLVNFIGNKLFVFNRQQKTEEIPEQSEKTED